MATIDKSKMSPEDRAAYEDILKKYGINEEEDPVAKSNVKPGENKEGEVEEDDLDKGCGKQTTKKSISGQADPEEDIYKGLHPAVKAEIESLRSIARLRRTESLWRWPRSMRSSERNRRSWRLF